MVQVQKLLTPLFFITLLIVLGCTQAQAYTTYTNDFSSYGKLSTDRGYIMDGYLHVPLDTGQTVLIQDSGLYSMQYDPGNPVISVGLNTRRSSGVLFNVTMIDNQGRTLTGSMYYNSGRAKLYNNTAVGLDEGVNDSPGSWHYVSLNQSYVNYNAGFRFNRDYSQQVDKTFNPGINGTIHVQITATSTVDGGYFDIDDYTVISGPEVDLNYTQNVVLYDDFSLDWLPGGEISVSDGSQTTTYTSTSGLYELTLKSGVDYTITATVDGYDSVTQTRTGLIDGGQWVIPLIRQSTCAYDVQVVDSSTGSLVEDVDIRVRDTVTGTWYNHTSASGLMNLAPIIKTHLHIITITKEGYATYTDSFTPTGNRDFPVTLINLVNPADPGKCYLTLNAVNDANSGMLLHYTTYTTDNQVYNSNVNGYTVLLLDQGTQYTLTVKADGFYAKDYTITPNNAVQTATVRLVSLPSATSPPAPGEATNLSLSYDSSVFIQRYKNYVNNTCNYTFGGLKTYWNNTIFNTIGQFNSTLNQRQAYQEQYYNQTDGFQGVFALFGLIFGMFPFEVKSLITYYFMWVGFLILMGK